MPATDQGANLDRYGDRYSLIPRALVFLTRGDQVLLLKGAENKRLWANRYNGVGGHVERGEDVLMAAIREVHEETGLTPVGLRLVGVVTVDAGAEVGIGIFVFRGECPEGEAVASAEGALEWVAFEATGNLPLVEDLPVLLPKVLQMQPGTPPFSAHYRNDEADRLVISFGE